MKYPRYTVDGIYTVYDAREMEMLAQVMADREGRSVTVMKANDAYTPAYVLCKYRPKVRE